MSDILFYIGIVAAFVLAIITIYLAKLLYRDTKAAHVIRSQVRQIELNKVWERRRLMIDFLRKNT
jgi:hypothetical protein